MPFENFYAESDKAARRWWKSIGLFFLLIIAYWSIPLLSMSKTGTDVEVKNLQVPSDSDRLRNVDELCTNLPRPEQFFLTWREDPIFYTHGTAAIYHFKSDRPLEEIMPNFTVWFAENGWHPDPKSDNSFRKDAQTISIGLDVYGTYQIYCYEAKTRPQIIE